MQSKRELLLPPDVQNIPIPKQIHYVWVGGPIKEKYLKDILYTAQLARNSGFIVNIWVNDAKNIHKTLERIYPDLIEMPASNKIAGIHIRHINELFPRMKEEKFFQEDNRGRDIQSYINREMIGFKNLASASDFLRYLILYFEGGYYIDTDVQIEFQEEGSPTFAEEKLLVGFKANMVNTHADGSAYSNWVGNNDMIAALPKHPIIKETLLLSLSNYKDLDKSASMSNKRWPYSKDKRSLTIEVAAGPGSLAAALRNFWSNHIKEEKDHCKQHGVFSTLDSMEMKELAGVSLEEVCDLTWCSTPDKQFLTAFDTNTLLASQNFFSLPPSEAKVARIPAKEAKIAVEPPAAPMAAKKIDQDEAGLPKEEDSRKKLNQS